MTTVRSPRTPFLSAARIWSARTTSNDWMPTVWTCRSMRAIISTSRRRQSHTISPMPSARTRVATSVVMPFRTLASRVRAAR